jgi:hypothetical protein
MFFSKPANDAFPENDAFAEKTAISILSFLQTMFAFTNRNLRFCLEVQ